MPNALAIIMEYREVIEAIREPKTGEMGQIGLTNRHCLDMLESGGKVDFPVLFELDRALGNYANFLFDYMSINGKTRKEEEEEDWEIPGTPVSSAMSTANKVLRMIRALTFLRVSTKMFKQTLPKPALTADVPIATAAVDATGDGADEGAELPHAALRPRLTPVYKFPANEELDVFGREFLAKAKNLEGLKSNPVRLEIIKKVNEEGDMKIFKECPVCRRPSDKFSKKSNFYKHIREGRCNEGDVKEFGGGGFQGEEGEGEGGEEKGD